MDEDDGQEEAMLMYVAIDVSKSMCAAIPDGKAASSLDNMAKDASPKKFTARDAADSALQHLFKAGFQDEVLRDLVKLGVVVFNDYARIHREAWEPTVNGLDVNHLPQCGGVTDFKRLFEKLRSVIVADAETAMRRRIRIKDPAIFLLSDGAPYVDGQVQRPDAYRSAVKALHDLRLARYRFPGETEVPDPGEPVVVPFGIGRSHPEALCEVVSPGYDAYQTDTSEIGDVVTRVMGAILDSLTASAAHRRITIVPPQRGIRVINCAGDLPSFGGNSR
jgi:hypothetical protein